MKLNKTEIENVLYKVFSPKLNKKKKNIEIFENLICIFSMYRYRSIHSDVKTHNMKKVIQSEATAE